MSSTLEPITRVEQFLSDIIEQGGGGGGGSGGGMLVVNVDEQTGVCDKTFSEIVNAFGVVFKSPLTDMVFGSVLEALYINYISITNHTIYLYYPRNNETIMASAQSENDYPVIQWGG